MRKLLFNVTGQQLMQDSNCDFSNLVKGSKGYLQAQFNFDADWSGLGKVALFNEQYAEQLDRSGVCMVPDEAAALDFFSVRVVGIRDMQQIRTNKIFVMQVR